MNHMQQKAILFLLSFLFLLFHLKSRKIFIPTGIRKIQFCIGLTFILFLISFSFRFLSCEESTAPVNKLQVTLTAEYVGVTEAELLLQTKNAETNTQYQFFRDDFLISDRTLIQAETIITDTLLLPAHNYTYKVKLLKKGKTLTESQPLQITTMDTTSYNFTWETFTSGTGGSSVLNDVSIISPDDIWAVGEISFAGEFYNVVHWDGQQWELKRITYGGSPWPIKSIWAFSSNDIWFDVFVRWNGDIFVEMPIPNVLIGFGINKTWGNPNGGLYVVGNQGRIAYSPDHGQSWQKLESGTDLPIQDIWGIPDPETGEPYILCPASDKYNVGEKKLLQINPLTYEVTILEWPYQDRRIHSVWFKDPRRVWICGAGVYINKNGQWKEYSEIPLIFTNRIRGMDINDIFVAGDFGILAHFNGVIWKTYPNAALGLYYSMDYKNKIAVAVGQSDKQAIILMLKPVL
jgi:hypothetical protein